MFLLGPRIHFFEINDQAWFPQFLREMVQACLELIWRLRVPLLQPLSPAAVVANMLQSVLAERIADYTYVDFCAGAGGPTLYIEQHLNKQLAQRSSHDDPGTSACSSVNFVLTDIAPHLPAWQAASKRSPHIFYVPTPVDASKAPSDLLALANVPNKSPRRTCRLFNLAFHHFDDALAARVLSDTLTNADAFAIVELQHRTLASLLTCTLLLPLLLLVTPVHFGRAPAHLFFTYVIPVVPLVVLLDGWVSSMRTRSAEEIEALMTRSGQAERWVVKSGSVMHMWPIGEVHWFVGTRRG